MLYCVLPENRLRGKQMGMTRLRDEIMKDIDRFENGKPVRDPRLGKEDLEHWMRKKNYLSDGKFQFIDRWLRTNRRDKKVIAALDNVLIYKERVLHEALATMDARDYDGAITDSENDLAMLQDSVFTLRF